MSLVLNTNIASMNASRHLQNTQMDQATTFERLSTGLRINSAKDDAAGMYLAQAQTKDIRGLSMATRNANDGISMAQTAEGAMDQIQQNLQRINELAIQSANGTYNDAAREGLQKEVDQLTQEINRITETTEFNGEKLLSREAGSLTMQIGFRNDEGSRIDAGLKGGLVAADQDGKFSIPGTNYTFDNKDQAQLAGEFSGLKALLADDVDPHAATAGDAAEITYANVAITDMDANGGATPTTTSNEIYEGLAQLGHPGDSFEVDGMTFTRQTSNVTDQYGSQLKIEFNGNETTVDDVWGDPTASPQTGIFDPSQEITVANLTDLFGGADNSAGGANSLNNALAPAAEEFFGNTAAVVDYEAAIPQIEDFAAFKSGDIQSLEMGETLEMNGWSFTRTTPTGGVAADTGTDLTVSYLGGNTAVISDVYAAYDTTNDVPGAYDPAIVGTSFDASADFAATLEGNTNIVSETGNLSNLLTGNLDETKLIDISTQEGAQKAIDFTRSAIDTISEIRATFGANMNRFEAVISGNQIYSENLTAARSRIQDADFATETANLAKQQVLQQAGIASLSQANASSQAILSLLG